MYGHRIHPRITDFGAIVASGYGGYIWFVNVNELDRSAHTWNRWKNSRFWLDTTDTPHIFAVTNHTDQQTTFDQVREVFSIPNHVPVVLCNPNRLESVNQVVRMYWQHILNRSELDAQQREDIHQIIERFRP
ncbi:MAG: hypothetical protein AAF125_17670 [Chloroflexota bacterium]